jgi:hypothetical protein
MDAGDIDEYLERIRSEVIEVAIAHGNACLAPEGAEVEVVLARTIVEEAFEKPKRFARWLNEASEADRLDWRDQEVKQLEEDRRLTRENIQNLKALSKSDPEALRSYLQQQVSAQEGVEESSCPAFMTGYFKDQTLF